MIAHVAAAGERRGRVVLWLGSSAAASRFAIEAAMLLGQAFQAEVESLYVEDKQLFDLADFPFARVIGASGDGWRPLPQAALECELRFAAAALHRQVAEATSRCEQCHAPAPRTGRGTSSSSASHWRRAMRRGCQRCSSACAIRPAR